MGSEIEITETPNWLNELEAKREKRLKTKLGHELGAGAPCVPCGERCPGLDLHFWRKICKNCKCSKENHEVPDDDIYGWAQDELLGTKVNRLKKKIVLPGRKEEVELDWAPNGQKETIDKYLKTLPAELLPIKGSQAAHDRKQLLKKQIPIHDIDPTLCHELTDEELKKMHDYVAHVKQSSVGVGHLIQINMGKGVSHILEKEKAMFLINNVPKGIASSENVLLHGSDCSVPLINEFDSLGLGQKSQLTNQNPQSPFSIENDLQNPKCMSLRDQHYNTVCDDDFTRYNSQINTDNNSPLSRNSDNTGMSNKSSPLFNRLYGNPNVKNLVPSAFVPIKSNISTNQKINSDDLNSAERSSVKELPYPSHFINDNLRYGRNLPSYNNNQGVNVSTNNEHQNPAYFEPIKDIRFSNDQEAYDNSKIKNSTSGLNVDNNADEISGHLRNEKVPLPNLSAGVQVLREETQKPTKINSIKDLAYSTYDSSRPEDNLHNLSVRDRINMIKQGEFPPSPFKTSNSPVSTSQYDEDNVSPVKFSTKDIKVPYNTNSNQDNSSYLGRVRSPFLQNSKSEFASQNKPNLTSKSLALHQSLPDKSKDVNKSNLASYAPETSKLSNITEDNLKPTAISIGGIKDIEYFDPEVHTALHYKDDDDLYEEGSTPAKIIPNLLNSKFEIPACHHCKKDFEEDELAIAIPERSEAVFHTQCFKCYGCNQILADMFYFYDKESDKVYCGRDYAKIRGIPRCKACDELIFVKEYCLAENSTFHVKHFCCFECDKPLAGQNYVMETDQPVCVPCYELTKANKCCACVEVIRPDQQGLQLKDGVHFHATEDCFSCKICRKSLFGAKLLFRNDSLYCSHDCYNKSMEIR